MQCKQGKRVRRESEASVGRATRPPSQSSQGQRPRGRSHKAPAGLPRGSSGLASLSDKELLDGLRRGSERHFDELYGRYFQRIYHFAYARLRHHADVEEIVQETFTAVFRSVDNYRGQASLLSWIYGIAKNTINNHIRRSRAHEQRIERAEPVLSRPPSSFAQCTPEESLCLQLYADEINRRLESIAPWQTEIFRMRHEQNLSIGEISRRTNRTSDAIRSSLYRVKRMLLDAADAPLVSERA